MRLFTSVGREYLISLGMAKIADPLANGGLYAQVSDPGRNEEGKSFQIGSAENVEWVTASRDTVSCRLRRDQAELFMREAGSSRAIVLYCFGCCRCRCRSRADDDPRLVAARGDKLAGNEDVAGRTTDRPAVAVVRKSSGQCGDHRPQVPLIAT